jgi:hypothetical protein
MEIIPLLKRSLLPLYFFEKTLLSLNDAKFQNILVDASLIKDAKKIIKIHTLNLTILNQPPDSEYYRIDMMAGDFLSENFLPRLRSQLIKYLPNSSVILINHFTPFGSFFEQAVVVKKYNCNEKFSECIIHDIYLIRPKPNFSFKDFYVKLFCEKLAFKFSFKLFFLRIISMCYINIVPEKRILVLTRKKSSDAIFARNNFGKFFYKIIYLNKFPLKINIANPFNPFLLEAKNFEQILAAIFAISLLKFKNVYFSMPGAFVVRRILPFIALDTNTIHIAHGRVSSEKFLNFTRYVFTEVYDPCYIKQGIKQKKILFRDQIKIKANRKAILFQGYKKGRSYGLFNLYEDIKIIINLLYKFEEIIVRPHPTAFILQSFLSHFRFFCFSRVRLDVSNIVECEVEKIYVSSPTYAIKLKNNNIPFVSLI